MNNKRKRKKKKESKPFSKLQYVRTRGDFLFLLSGLETLYRARSSDAISSAGESPIHGVEMSPGKPREWGNHGLPLFLLLLLQPSHSSHTLADYQELMARAPHPLN
jgi:hypothetical protein